MDGRTQVPVIEWMKQKYGVSYVDMITEPGTNGIMAEDKNQAAIASIKRRVEISVAEHDSKVVAVVGHHDCAANPVSKEEHLRHISQAMKVVGDWGFRVQVIGLWVDENWQVNQVR